MQVQEKQPVPLVPTFLKRAWAAGRRRLGSSMRAVMTGAGTVLQASAGVLRTPFTMLRGLDGQREADAASQAGDVDSVVERYDERPSNVREPALDTLSFAVHPHPRRGTA
jgi:hypothetical protein